MAIFILRLPHLFYVLSIKFEDFDLRLWLPMGLNLPKRTCSIMNLRQTLFFKSVIIISPIFTAEILGSSHPSSGSLVAPTEGSAFQVQKALCYLCCGSTAGILGHKFDKRLEYFAPCNSQSFYWPIFKENQTTLV